MKTAGSLFLWAAFLVLRPGGAAEDFPKPYSPPCTERENVFEFTEKPAIRFLGEDEYQITFAVKGNCDVTAAIVDESNKVVRHLGAGVLGSNAPAPFQKNSLKQTLLWNGKDDLDQYPKEPAKLRARVMLGLKPTFDKLLDEGGPKDLPGRVWAILIDPDGAYVFCRGSGNMGLVTVRKFDREGNYLASLVPPPANFKEDKLGGLARIGYEAGQWALHGADVYSTVADRGNVLPGTGELEHCGRKPVLLGRRLAWPAHAPLAGDKQRISRLHWMFTDGSTDAVGVQGVPFLQLEGYNPSHPAARLATSPDGKRIYSTSLGPVSVVGYSLLPMVMVTELGTGAPGKVLAGDPKKPGSDNTLLNEPLDLDCDAAGNVYVADHFNNRVQVYSPEGKFLQTIRVPGPVYLCVHRKSGAVYVLHKGQTQGVTGPRLTKFTSKDNPTEEFHQDWQPFGVMALDHWSDKPRLWAAGGGGFATRHWGRGAAGVQIWEEQGKQFVKIGDFDEDAAKVLGGPRTDKWKGVAGRDGGHLTCDPTRGLAYWGPVFFDLKTGKITGQYKINAGYDDVAFDKRGYLHVHFNPGFYMPGVGRVDPSQGTPWERDKNVTFYPEIPYDYGEEKTGTYKTTWLGVLPVRDQPGAKYFQDGLGVNMRGDVAENCNIYYVPKMEEEGGLAALGANFATIVHRDHGDLTYAGFLRQIQEQIRRGEEVYFIRRQPGIPLAGATIWTFDATGELRQECAATIGNLINGVQMDEDGKLYFVGNRPKFAAGKAFLDGKGGTFGLPDDKHNRNLGFYSGPFTGTLLKTAGKGVRVAAAKAPVPLDPPPDRPAELCGGYGEDSKIWVEGAEWLYAGASPIVYMQPCSCPTQRMHLDWWKRSFVPEAYRHSVGVLDTNGNLILHLGRYGNYDSGFGADSKIPTGGDHIAMFLPRFISGTDDHLIVFDWAERLVLLKLNYHAEETVPIQAK